MSYEIIDSHCHFWQPDLPDRPWDPEGFNVGPSVLVDELLRDAAAAGVTRIMQVTPTIMRYDNTYGIECTRTNPKEVVGVCARFDPIAPDVASRLAALQKIPEIKVIRITLNRKPWNTWLQNRTLDPLWAAASEMGMPVAITAANQALQICDVAKRFPKVRILVDHMAISHNRFDTSGNATIDPFEHWQDVLDLAKARNVYIKVSCFPEVAHELYPFRSILPRLKELRDSYGANRMIWGSNYPPSREICSYKESASYIPEAADFLNDSEKRMILGGSLLAAIAS